jgi:hypothetical protein
VTEPTAPTAPRELPLGWRSKLLLRAGVLAGALVATWLGVRVDPAPFLAPGASEDALRRRRYLVRQVCDVGVLPKDIGTELDQFKGEYAYGTYSMTAYALTNLALDAPAPDAPDTRAETVRVLDRIIDAMASDEIARFDTTLWGQRALDALDSDRGHIAYLGHLNLVIGARRLLGGDATRDALHDRLTAAIARRLAAAPHRHAETYPGETYTMDTIVAVASLEVARHARGIDHRALVDEWIAYVRAHLLDARTGLIVFGVDQATGAPLQRGRGSAAGWASFFLPLIDDALAREQRERLRASLGERLGPFAGTREWAPDDPAAGLGDIDSGPVLGWGVSASGFSIAAARLDRDADRLGGLLTLVETFGISTDEGAGERRYVGAPLLGEAILLAMKTARPWWDR